MTMCERLLINGEFIYYIYLINIAELEIDNQLNDNYLLVSINMNQGQEKT